jgi:hypothetical protein
MVTAEELADSVAPEGVHSHIPQRPLFTDSSRPSLDEVAGLTMSTAQAVIGAVGGSLSDHLKPFAVVVVETGTAAKVEQSYFPEQQPGGTGPPRCCGTSTPGCCRRCRPAAEDQRGGARAPASGWCRCGSAPSAAEPASTPNLTDHQPHAPSLTGAGSPMAQSSSRSTTVACSTVCARRSSAALTRGPRLRPSRTTSCAWRPSSSARKALAAAPRGGHCRPSGRRAAPVAAASSSAAPGGLERSLTRPAHAAQSAASP